MKDGCSVAWHIRRTAAAIGERALRTSLARTAATRGDLSRSGSHTPATCFATTITRERLCNRLWTTVSLSHEVRAPGVAGATG